MPFPASANFSHRPQTNLKKWLVDRYTGKIPKKPVDRCTYVGTLPIGRKLLSGQQLRTANEVDISVHPPSRYLVRIRKSKC